MKIPNEWHNNLAYNDLSNEEFAELQNIYEVDDTLHIDDNECECETYTINDCHRCSCGNRRCVICADHYNGKILFHIECW